MARLGTISSAVGCLLLVSACGSDPSAEGDPSDGTVRVFAAASLVKAFDEEATAFEDAHPGVSVELNFGGSSSLREQILAGAPADVFASADESDMDQLREAGEVEEPEVFATNRMQIAVPANNPGRVQRLADLAERDLLIGLCAAQVPCGDLARRVLSAAGVRASVDTNEPDVRALLTKIEEAELDAGLVYATDVVSAGERVIGIDVPSAADLVARYPIAPIASGEDADRAEAFVRFVLGAEGQAILRDHGFGAP
jgi:molybdate transport system substrate-binding protein